jgi:hypothetical protein
MGPLTNHDESESGLGNTLPGHRAGSPSLLTLLGPNPKTAAGFNEYLCLRKVKGWKNKLPSMKVTESVALVSNPGSEVQLLVPFTQRSLVKHIVDFIIADDQVSTLSCRPYFADFFPLVNQRC